MTYRDTAPTLLTTRYWRVQAYCDAPLDAAALDAAWETAARRLGIDLTTGPPIPTHGLHVRAPSWLQGKGPPGCAGRVRGLAWPHIAVVVVDDPSGGWLLEHEAGHCLAYWRQGIDPRTHAARSERAASLAEGHPISLLGAWLRGWTA
jgi:hypothetical protein